LHHYYGDYRGHHRAPYAPLTAQREQLVLERDALDIEWRNLILEENALGDHSRVERIATEKLQMQHVDPSQENIVVQK
jgi:cell division protein FtsL